MIFQEAIESAIQPSRSDGMWDTYEESVQSSLERLEGIIDDVAEMQKVCKDEWCEATECLLQEATLAAFAISEPHWESKETSNRIRELKKRIHDLHVKNSRRVVQE